MLVLAAACALAAPATAARTAPAAGSSALEQAVLSEVNALRVSKGLAPLRYSRPLAAAARAHSAAMATRGFFSHSSADGSAFWKRVQRHYRSRGYGRWSVGENLLWSSRELNAAAALDIWLNSPKHRTIMLRAHWREVGVGAVHVVSGRGVYRGHEVTIVTADFGVRR